MKMLILGEKECVWGWVLQHLNSPQRRQQAKTEEKEKWGHLVNIYVLLGKRNPHKSKLVSFRCDQQTHAHPHDNAYISSCTSAYSDRDRH